jgi:phosphotransferase system enzyme I (PtsI)
MNSEQEQYEAYKTLAEAVGPDGAIVRLFDVGGEIANDTGERERNPALGLRAVRFGLRHKDVMRAQVRAILRAATAGRLSLVIPMIADLADVKAAKTLIGEEVENLRANGDSFAEVPIGAMIEVPSAVLTAEIWSSTRSRSIVATIKWPDGFARCTRLCSTASNARSQRAPAPEFR